MTSPGLHPGARPVAACFRAVCRRLAYVRGHERTLESPLLARLEAVLTRVPGVATSDG